jgi:hypothetical protein
MNSIPQIIARVSHIEEIMNMLSNHLIGLHEPCHCI